MPYVPSVVTSIPVATLESENKMRRAHKYLKMTRLGVPDEIKDARKLFSEEERCAFDGFIVDVPNADPMRLPLLKPAIGLRPTASKAS